MVRISAAEESIDVVVGKVGWHAEVVKSANLVPLASMDVPVARPADLVLLKLYAGGPQDAWDIEQLLQGAGAEVTAQEIDRRVGELPEDSRELWNRIRRRA